MNDSTILVIDARMINNSGIGRVLRNIIPNLATHFKQIVLLGDRNTIASFEWYRKEIKIIQYTGALYGIKEQIDYIRLIPSCDIFISPHYNAPIFSWKIKNLVTFFHDVNHLVFKEHLTVAQRVYAAIQYNLASLRSKTIFTISDFSESEIKKHLFVRPKNLIVPKIGLERRKIDSKDKVKLVSSKYILFVGNVKPHKNLKRALAAFLKLIESGYNGDFCIVGNRAGFINGADSVLEEAEQNQILREKVIFTGFIQDELLDHYYDSADLLLFPSLYEGFGLPPIEAMMFGCPVVSSNSASMPEVCGDAAVYFDPYDVDEMYDSMREVLKNDSLRMKMIEKGLKRINMFSWASSNEIILNSLNKLKIK